MNTTSDMWMVIRDAQDAKNWTNAKLAEVSGVAESTIQKYLTGRTSEPRFDNVVAMCRALNLSIDRHCGIDSNASVDEIAELRAALALAAEKVKAAEADKKTAEAQRETAETKLQSQIHEYNQMVSAYEYRIDIAKDRTIWLRRGLIAVGAVTVLLMASIVGVLVYDITHPDMGWFQQAQAYFNAGIARLTGKV